MDRIRFTTRDWMWLCVVLALAFGWGGHFRYSQWVEDNYQGQRPTVYRLQNDLERAGDQIIQLRGQNERLRKGMEELIGELQDRKKRASKDD